MDAGRKPFGIRRAIMCSSTVWVAGLLLMGRPVAFAQTEPAVGAPRALSPVEQRILAAIDSQSTDAVALLERTVNIPSATLNLVGVRRVGDIFAAELQHLGFAIRWVSMPQTMQRSGHLFAERVGAKGNACSLSGISMWSWRGRSSGALERTPVATA